MTIHQYQKGKEIPKGRNILPQTRRRKADKMCLIVIPKKPIKVWMNKFKNGTTEERSILKKAFFNYL